MSNSPKSILIINRVFPPAFGATGRLACDLALYLRKQGHKITVLTTASSPKIDIAKNLEVIRVGANPKPEGFLAYRSILRALRKKALQLPPHDIVISMTDPPLLAQVGDEIARRTGAKHIHWSMDIYPDLLPVIGKNVPKFAYRWAEKKTYKAIKRATAIVPISKCMARYMAHKSLPRHKMYIIENWPDKYLLDNDDDNTSLFDSDKFRILYAGTIGLSHDFTTVLKAAKYLQTAQPEIEFVFTATGRARPILENNIKQMGLTNIRLIQPQSSKRLTNLMATGDLHLMTMKAEALGKIFPSKFYSACAAARPVLFVGPKECDLHEKITRNQCGASVRNGDAQSLVKAILKYLNDGDAWFEASNNISKIIDQQNPLDEWGDLIASL